MAVSIAEASDVFREALRNSVRRHSFWYLVQGIMLTVTGLLSVIYPVISSVAVVTLLGWLL